MSSPRLSFDGPLRPIDVHAAAQARDLAAGAPRDRAIVRYSDHADGTQRMLNAIEPASYVRPHRHLDPPKVETFVALTGRALLVVFDDAGEVLEAAEMAAGGPCWGAEVPEGVWHGIVAAAPGTVLYEVIGGAYSPASHKDFAPWAPAEGGPEGRAYLAGLRARLGLDPL